MMYLGMPFLAEWVRNKGHFWKSQTTATEGANQLLQMQEEMWRQFTMGENIAESEIESHILSNKDMMMSSLWKLNVVDIEVTLLHVCETDCKQFKPSVASFDKVLQENNVKREKLKSRALALKILGKSFQKEKQNQLDGISKRKSSVDVEDDISLESSSSEVFVQSLSYRTPFMTQGIGRLFRCLCNPTYGVDGDEIVYKSK